MKISTKGRYGLRALIDLAQYSEIEPVSISSIATRQAISEVYLEQLMSMLKKAGLIKSIRGAGGGYVLARDMSEISVGDVLRALERSLQPVECAAFSQEESCEASGGCVTKYVWQRINERINQTVNEISLKQLVEEIELQQRHKDEAQQKMTALCMEWFPQEVENLQTIPGVKERSATSIIAEIGTDMTHFQTPKKLVSWVGLRPRNEESAGKIKARGITHGNRFVRKTMIECSWGAARMKDSFFAEFSYRQCIERRKNKMKVQVAIARKILVAVWYVLSQGTQYIKPTDHYTAAHMTAV